MLTWFLFLIEPFRIFEEKTKDYMLLLRAEKKSSGDVRLVGIDDDSIVFLGRWPWSRDYHAELIQLLSIPEFKPRIIGYDVFFSEPDSGNRQADERLIKETTKAANLCYAYFFSLVGKKPVAPKDEGKSKRQKLLPFALENVSGSTDKLYQAASITLPLEGLLDKVDLGFANVLPDSDGIIRRLPLVIRYEDKIYPAFSLQLISKFLGLDSSAIYLDLNKKEIAVKRPDKTIRIPINKIGEMRINYLGSIKSFFSDSFLQVMSKGNQAINLESQEAHNWLSRFRDKIVLVGGMATGIVDTVSTPLSQSMPGILIHANAVENILSENFLYETPAWLRLIIYFAIGMLILVIGVFLKPAKGAFVALGIIAFYLGINSQLFYSQNLSLEVLRPVAGGFSVYVAVTIQRYIAEEKEKRWIKNAFSHYLSESILSQVLKDPSGLRLGGVRRKITVLFCDIRNFTPYCENHPAEETVGVLNEFFDEMTRVILRHGGTLDKYMGDEIMAFFGAPLAQEPASCALQACRAALEMKERLDYLRKKWLSENRVPLEMGIGINTGFMIAGNIGSSSIMNYTVIGDEVNLASRVQRLTREYQKTIIITENTYKENESKIIAEFMETVKVKGKEKSVAIYALSGIKDV